MTVVAYARVSTIDQNPELQFDALKNYGCTKIFTDSASGCDRERPQLAKCLAFLRKGDVLVFWKLDRLARSTVHLGQIAEACREKCVDLKCLTQPIDTTTPTGRMMFNILACFAEFERDIIVERTLAGLAAARARGRIGGRPRGPAKGKRVLVPPAQVTT
jgi:DNA invertase Pin-like site-specific DNA recombinase